MASAVPGEIGVCSSSEDIADRIRGALWGIYIGDALAMPVHWYYDLSRLKKDFGRITHYEPAPSSFPGSIMNLSNTGGGGRGSYKGDIVGRVILHGKRQYWVRGGGYHYHHGLKAGENTLEAQLTRVLTRSITHNRGTYNRDKWLEDYVQFMTTPGSHNDVYAATAHRMFFANWDQKKPLSQCADNDGHNTDAIDGLVNLAPVVIAARYGGKKRSSNVIAEVHDAIGSVRRSSSLPRYGEMYADILQELLQGKSLGETIAAASAKVGIDIQAVVQSSPEDPMTACYIQSSYPAMLFFAYKYQKDFSQALLASTNAGGENVARGAVLGSLLGAHFGYKNIPSKLKSDLLAHKQIEEEIEKFISTLDLS